MTGAQGGVDTRSDVRHRLPVRTLVAASIGNSIEWYDWTVYATFSIYFATQIFPNDDTALVNTFATYAVAFFLRPLGGWLLGRFADVRGRRTAMILTIVLMAGGSTVIALLPTYDQVGWLDRLAARAGKTGGPPAIWVLVAGDATSARPVLDGQAIPVLDSSQYAQVPESWLRNEHRAGAHTYLPSRCATRPGGLTRGSPGPPGLCPGPCRRSRRGR